MVQLSIEDFVSEHSPGRLLRAINRQMHCFAERRFAGAEVSFVQWLALKVIHDGSVKTAGELSRELKMTTGAITRLVDVLERRAYVRRNRDRSDRRVVHLLVTPMGSAKILEMAPVLTTAWNDILVDFGSEEFGRFTAAMVKLLAAFETEKACGPPAPTDISNSND